MKYFYSRLQNYVKYHVKSIDQVSQHCQCGIGPPRWWSVNRPKNNVPVCKEISSIVIFLDLISTKQGLPLVDSWSGGLDKKQIYPNSDTSSNIPRSGFITARDQSMVESDVTEGGKNTASFLFREWTQQFKHEASSEKATIFKVIPLEKQQLVEEKDADNIRKVWKVLCKSFIQWFKN